MEDLGRNFPESFIRLNEQHLFSTKTKMIGLIVIFILNLLIFLRGPSVSISTSIVLLSIDFILFGIIILEPYFERRKSTSKLEEIRNTLSYIIMKLRSSNIIQNTDEEVIFRKNFESFHVFKLTNNYKYCMLAMGSMLEFVLKRYCQHHQIKPDPFIGDDGKSHPGNKFSNYIQTAINRNLFDQKKRWIIVQNSLRDFRNYVHISKEVKEEEIDSSWYLVTVPTFVSLLLSFN